jgi:hypothetical protein
VEEKLKFLSGHGPNPNYKLQIIMFKTPANHPVYVLTTRFNDATFEENTKWRERSEHPGCVYCSPKSMPKAVPADAIILMIEMNNQQNQIAGFGMLINKRKTDRERNLIYADRNYNRYVYRGDIRADRTWLLEHNSDLIEKLEILIFKGKDHIKRGVGFTSIPKKKMPFFEKDGYGEQFQQLIHRIIGEK